MFPDVHAAGKNDLHLFRACGRETLRGFFDTLSCPGDSLFFACRITVLWQQRPAAYAGAYAQYSRMTALTLPRMVACVPSIGS